MAGKKQPYKRTRTSTMRIGWIRGEKSWRRLFLLEMARSNNVIRAIQKAQIKWSTYVEWCESGFLSQEMLAQAESTFRLKHPHVDMLSSRKPDDEGISGIPIDDSPAVDVHITVKHTNSPSVVIGPGVYELLKGYNEQEVMQPEGWMDTDGYGSDE